MYFITLLRHGESEGNSSGILQGQAEYPLTKAGVEQAERLGRYWAARQVGFDHVISSPLRRAAQTAEIIAQALGVPLELDPAWMERNFGSLQGAEINVLDGQQPPVDFFHPYLPIGETGESQLDVYIRAGLALQNILRREPGEYLVVSHGGILNKAVYVILGITPQGHFNSPIIQFGNTGYAQFRYNSQSRQWAVLSLNNQPADNQAEGLDSWQHD